MKVLIIKTSSLGDIIHTLPALTDAARIYPNIVFDWVVEESFAEIPHWHPKIRKVIPMAWRRWRKNIFSKQTLKEAYVFWQTLREEQYDFIIDAQGLVKSAWLTLFAKGQRCGLDWHSARESLASLWYQKKCTVNFYQHAIIRMRSIFSKILNYPFPEGLPEYGISRQSFMSEPKEDYLVFLHGTTWNTKLWPEVYWIELANLLAKENLKVKLLWGNAEEKARAERIAQQGSNIEVLPRQNLEGSAKVLANAKAIVAVDTGFTHLAAALNVPTVSLYGPTNPLYTGAMGKSQICLASDLPCSPCLKRECTYLGKSAVFPACFVSLAPLAVFRSIQKNPFFLSAIMGE